jgi:hypothetical protein
MNLRKQTDSKTFLFSIDLEDIRLGVTNGSSYENRVPINTYKYLNWFVKKKERTFYFDSFNFKTFTIKLNI